MSFAERASTVQLCVEVLLDAQPHIPAAHPGRTSRPYSAGLSEAFERVAGGDAGFQGRAAVVTILGAWGWSGAWVCLVGAALAEAQCGPSVVMAAFGSFSAFVLGWLTRALFHDAGSPSPGEGAGMALRARVNRGHTGVPFPSQEPVMSTRVPLPGSHRRELADAEVIAPVDAATSITVTLVLRRRGVLTDETLQRGLSREELAAQVGADPADVELVTRSVTAAGAHVGESDLPSRRVRVTGDAATLQELFGTRLYRARVTRGLGAGREVRHRTGELSVPGELDGVVTAVLGLDDRPQADTRFETRAAAPSGGSFTPPQLAKVYGMPAADGAGQTVAIIELGGGFAQSELATYFTGLGVPSPAVTAVGVDGATNVAGGDPKGADGEVLLDIEVVGAIVPQARIVVYFAPNTDAGFLDAVSTATHATPTPTAMSISWGQSEDAWTAQARTVMDQAFADACALGVTVTAAAGDSGSSDNPKSSRPVHVDFPASSPHVLGCGGTSLLADTATGTLRSETVWNNGPSRGATGGGISDVFPLPPWQATAGVAAAAKHPGAHPRPAGRGVPDVAADADPRTGYQVLVDGVPMVIGGTSAVAPLWAALVCRLAQLKGHPFGLLQPRLYAGAVPGRSPQGFRDITNGNNGHWHAAPGWDPCTGLGVPVGTDLLTLL